VASDSVFSAASRPAVHANGWRQRSRVTPGACFLTEGQENQDEGRKRPQEQREQEPKETAASLGLSQAGVDEAECSPAGDVVVLIHVRTLGPGDVGRPRHTSSDTCPIAVVGNWELPGSTAADCQAMVELSRSSTLVQPGA
jgi:hypothetical protein